MGFKLFNIFKKKAGKKEEKKPIEKMSFRELIDAIDALFEKRLTVDLNDEAYAEIENETTELLKAIKVMVADPENKEAQAFVEELEKSYIYSQTHLKRIKKRQAEVEEIEKRYSTLKGRTILAKAGDISELTPEEVIELKELEEKRPERLDEKAHLRQLRMKESNMVTLLKLRMRKYGIKSEKVKEFDEQLQQEAVAEILEKREERVKRMSERDEKRNKKSSKKEPKNEGSQPGDEE